MDPRKLEYFLAIADEGGFSAAARSCGVSQPALSAAMRDLEAEVGCPLFERLPRRALLTPAGRALSGPARQVLRDIDTARAAVSDVAGLRSGSLSLCALPTLTADPLAPLVGRFRQAHPGVLVDLAAPEDAAQLVELLRTARCELGITQAADTPEDLETRSVGNQELVVVLDARFATMPDPLPLQALKGMALVTTPAGTSSRNLLEEGLGAAGVEPVIAVVTAQRDAILPLVLAGSGAALLPEALAAVSRGFGGVVRHPLPPIRRQVAVLHRRGPLAPAAQRFLAMLTR